MKRILCTFFVLFLTLTLLWSCGTPTDLIGETAAESTAAPYSISSTISAESESETFEVDHVTDRQSETDAETTAATASPPHTDATSAHTDVDGEECCTCTLLIECSSVFSNWDELDVDKREIIPSDGVMFKAQTVIFYEGETVYDVLKRVCRENRIHMEASFTPMYNSSYVEGIGNLYEFDCGSGSGWMYRVDGWYPNYGCSRYQLKQGEVVEWRYTCDLGKDIGGANAVDG